MAIGSIIYLDSNVYGHAASRSGDDHQRLLAAEAQSLINFVKLDLLRLVHSDWVEKEVNDFKSLLLRRRVQKAMPQARHFYDVAKVVLNDFELAERLAEAAGLDSADAVHAVLASKSGAEFIVSAETGNFIDKLQKLADRDAKTYDLLVGNIRAVRLLEWYPKVIGHGKA